MLDRRTGDLLHEDARWPSGTSARSAGGRSQRRIGAVHELESSKPTTETSPGTLRPAAARPGSRPVPSGRRRTSIAGDAAWIQAGAAPRGRPRARSGTWRPRPASGPPRPQCCGRGELAAGGGVVGRAEQQPDPDVPQRDQMPIGLIHRDASSHETRGKPRPSIAALISTAGRPRSRTGVVTSSAVSCAVEPAAEDDAERAAGAASLRSRPPRRRRRCCVHSTGVNTALGEGDSDHLREGREDRVLELRKHEPDQPGALPAQL